MRKLNYLFILPFTVLLFSACAESEIETIPDNVLTDSEGINITLEWSTGSSVTEALDQVDLDLSLNLNNNKIEASSNSFSFENVSLESYFTDGSYELELIYYDGNVDVDYTLYVMGASSESSRTYEYRGSFNASDKGLSITDLTIKKIGNKYTITD